MVTFKAFICASIFAISGASPISMTTVPGPPVISGVTQAEPTKRSSTTLVTLAAVKPLVEPTEVAPSYHGTPAITSTAMLPTSPPDFSKLHKRQDATECQSDDNGITIEICGSPTAPGPPAPTTTIWDTYDISDLSLYVDQHCLEGDPYGAAQSDVMNAVDAYCSGLQQPYIMDADNDWFNHWGTTDAQKPFQMSLQYNPPADTPPLVHAVTLNVNLCYAGYFKILYDCPLNSEGTASGGTIDVSAPTTDGLTFSFNYTLYADFPLPAGPPTA